MGGRTVISEAVPLSNPYWKNKGGITVSGGEAMLQMEFVTELFYHCRKAYQVHTALDTSGGSVFGIEEEYLQNRFRN